MKSKESYIKAFFPVVAPARERGLKLPGDTFTMDCTRRSRKGAWIEINSQIASMPQVSVAPARERGLKSARPTVRLKSWTVAPARERGLKFYHSPDP